MLIGIDASRASGKFRTGTENYSLNLILSLAKIDQRNNYVLYLRQGYDSQLNNLPGNFKFNYGMKWGVSLISFRHFSRGISRKSSYHWPVCLRYDRLKRFSPAYSNLANLSSTKGDIAFGGGAAVVHAEV